MFFFFSKALNFLIDPTCWIFMTLLLAIFAKKPGWRKTGLISAFLFFLLFTNPIMANWVLRMWEYPYTPKDELPLVETAVVLGGMTQDHTSSPDQINFSPSADRIMEPLTLYQDGLIQKIIISGGSGELTGARESESSFLKELSITLGVRPKDLLIDTLSRNTHENAVETKKILENMHEEDRPVLLVTSAFHMRRSLLCYQKEGIEVIPYAVDYQSQEFDWNPSWIMPTGYYLDTWRMLIKEWVGLQAYRMAGYI